MYLLNLAFREWTVLRSTDSAFASETITTQQGHLGLLGSRFCYVTCTTASYLYTIVLSRLCCRRVSLFNPVLVHFVGSSLDWVLLYASSLFPSLRLVVLLLSHSLYAHWLDYKQQHLFLVLLCVSRVSCV